MTAIRVGEERDPIFPAEWQAALRRASPVSDRHAYAVPVWYRYGQRWVLYLATPHRFLTEHWSQPVAPGFTAQECLDEMAKGPPSSRDPWDRCDYVSDVQWGLWRTHDAYCRPWWVLQGEDGGHPASFTPDQQNLLSALHQPTTPPPIGRRAFERAYAAWADRQATEDDPGPPPPFLQPCPLDERVLAHVRREHRAAEVRDLAGAAGRVADRKRHERELRVAELAAIEQFLTPATEMAMSLHTRADARDHLIMLDGEAAKAKERLAFWLETGNFVRDPQVAVSW